MSVAHAPEQEAVNADSFLDIVASVVSIMLIMVMMIGMRIRNTSVDALVQAAVADSQTALDDAQGAERSLRADVQSAADRIEQVQRETAARAAERQVLGLAVATMEHDIRVRREGLDAQARQDFDLVQGIARTRQQLVELDRARQQAAAAEPEAVVMRNRPTPLSQAVDGRETHFQLRNGRIVYVPLDALLQAFKSDVMRQVQKLRDGPELNDTVGPIGGFRLRYTMVRKSAAVESSHGPGHAAYAQLDRWTLIPTADDLGETADAALGAQSDFRAALADCKPGRGTITLWVYPDSFAAFRRVREELYRLGYTVAARPLPAGTPIGGSPEGSKSASQ
jgi:hypothetical protein